MNMYFRKILVVVVVFGIGVLLWVVPKYLDYINKEQLREGVSFFKSGNYVAARQLIEPFANEGNRNAQHLLGTIYAFGLGVEEDELKARNWFRRSERDIPVSNVGLEEYHVALDYLDEGMLAKPDKKKALIWMIYSAEAGNFKARQLLSNSLLSKTMGLELPDHEASRWSAVLESQ